MGAALAFGGVAALDKKLTIDHLQAQALLSVAAGFAGHKLLLAISSKLTKEVEEEVKKTGDEMKQEVKKTGDEMKREITQYRELVHQELAEHDRKRGVLQEAVTTLTAALNDSNPPESQIFKSIAFEARRKAELAMREFPANRQLAILVGRLEVKLHGFERAITLLTQCLSFLKDANNEETKDFGDLLYNRACYKNQLADQVQHTTPARAAALKKEAWNDLKESCRLNPSNREEAKNDPDLASLFNESDRQRENL